MKQFVLIDQTMTSILLDNKGKPYRFSTHKSASKASKGKFTTMNSSPIREDHAHALVERIMTIMGGR